MEKYIIKDYKKYGLKGKVFGNLTVLFDFYNPAENYKSRHYCHCRCICGKEKDYKAYALKVGDAKSCGCLQHNGLSHVIHDLTNKRFGRLVALYYSGESKWYCKCDCGAEVDVLSQSLISGTTKSCGCFSRDTARKLKLTHGMTKTRFYSIWCNMRKRCNDPHIVAYTNYGARGITVCDSWKNSFENFRDDMYKSYQEHVDKFGEKNTSIDRIDVDGDYCKENCRWATAKEQAVNRSNNHLITFDGKTLTIAQWATVTHINPKKLWGRIVKLKWPVERALTT